MSDEFIGGCTGPPYALRKGNALSISYIYSPCLCCWWEPWRLIMLPRVPSRWLIYLPIQPLGSQEIHASLLGNMFLPCRHMLFQPDSYLQNSSGERQIQCLWLYMWNFNQHIKLSWGFIYPYSLWGCTGLELWCLQLSKHLGKVNDACLFHTGIPLSGNCFGPTFNQLVRRTLSALPKERRKKTAHFT